MTRTTETAAELRLARVTLLALCALAPGSQVSAQTAGDSCPAPDARIRIDHVPIAVDDLDALQARFRQEFGFSIKPGRPHDNGLENAHIKFQDGSALELMTVGEPRDGVAQRYADLITDGGGGAYLALSGLDVQAVRDEIAPSEAEIEVTEGGAFDIASFPRGHLLHGVFFVDVHTRAPDEPEHTDHRNGARSLEAVWIAVEQPMRLTRLLQAFGGRDCGMSRHPEHLFGRAVGVDGGIVYVVDAGLWEADPDSAPIVSLTVKTDADSDADNFILGEAGGLWIELRPETDASSERGSR